jgi:hypothetical protein
MAKFKSTYHLDIPPKRLFDALVDFSDSRTQWWPYISPKHYQVGEVDAKKAKIREGTSFPLGAWAWEEYTYSWDGQQGKVRWTIQESNIAQKGGYVEAKILPEGDGTRVELDYNRQAKGLRGRMAGVMMQTTGRKILGSGMKKTAGILKENYPNKKK